MYQVRGGLPGAGKEHLKCSNKKLVKASFACLRQKKRFYMSMWYQVRWFGRSIKTLLTRSRFDPVSKVPTNVD